MSEQKLLKAGRAVVTAEAAALADLAKILDKNFSAAALALSNIADNGHIVVSGIGKAGLIGAKISATLSSIGLPSFFLHPAEALHGDLGRYSKRDIALILSNSGQTTEILQTLPIIKKIGCRILAITGNPDSELAAHSDWTVNIGQHSEAGHLGLAPTSSTIKMLACGDALAMAIFQHRKLAPEDFALYHPAGSLGQKLLKCSEIMRCAKQIALVSPKDSVRSVVKQYSATPGRPGAAIVVDQQNKLLGIFTDGDLRRILDAEVPDLKRPVEHFMGQNVKVITPEELASVALGLMQQHQVDQLVVIDKNREVLGMLDVQDLIRI